MFPSLLTTTTTTVFIPHLRSATYCFCTLVREPSPPQHSQSRHRETSPAWRSQQRLTLVPTSPHQVYLPGGASSPALYIPHLPLPSLLEHLQLALSPHHSFHLHLSTASLRFARPCVRHLDLALTWRLLKDCAVGQQVSNSPLRRFERLRLLLLISYFLRLSILTGNIQISQVLLCPNQHRRIDLGSPHRCCPASSHAGRYTSTNVGPFLEAWSGRRPRQ